MYSVARGLVRRRASTFGAIRMEAAPPSSATPSFTSPPPIWDAPYSARGTLNNAPLDFIRINTLPNFPATFSPCTSDTALMNSVNFCFCRASSTTLLLSAAASSFPNNAFLNFSASKGASASAMPPALIILSSRYARRMEPWRSGLDRTAFHTSAMSSAVMLFSNCATPLLPPRSSMDFTRRITVSFLNCSARPFVMACACRHSA